MPQPAVLVLMLSAGKNITGFSAKEYRVEQAQASCWPSGSIKELGRTREVPDRASPCYWTADRIKSMH